jgi:fatty-acyl-CoA synthase
MTTAAQQQTRLDWRDEDWPATVLHEVLAEALARRGPDTIAYRYVDAGIDLTLGALQAEADRWTAALVAAGVQAGDRVAVALGGVALWPILQVACSQAGAVVVGLNTRYGTHELEHVLAGAAPAVVVTVGNRDGRTFADVLARALATLAPDPAPTVVVVDGVAPDAFVDADAFLAAGAGTDFTARRAAVQPTDLALIQYTSGSTSAPKGVELDHDTLLRTAFHVGAAAGYDETDVVYSALPFYHVGGSICTGPGALVSGVMMVIPEAYDALTSVRQMIAERCTAEQGHAAMFTMQIDAAREAGVLGDLALRKGWVAAPPSVMQRIAGELGIAGVVPVYGMSEYGLICAGGRDEPLDERVSGVGWPAPGTEVRLVDVGDGGVGAIEVRGSQMMRGYRNDPAGTDAARDADGWLRTGDLGRHAPDGRMIFAGREKEMLKPGGENVSAAEIEEFLRDHPRIAAVAVIGVRDARLGEAPAAIVQAIGPAPLTLDDVRAFCDGRIARFKTPKALFVVPELPLLANGKIDKVSLNGRYGDHEVPR